MKDGEKFLKVLKTQSKSPYFNLILMLLWELKGKDMNLDERVREKTFFLWGGGVFLNQLTSVKENYICLVPLRTRGISKTNKTRCVLVSLCCHKSLDKTITLKESSS